MTALLEAFSRQLEARAGATDFAVRRNAMATALKFDLPHGRVEDWKYTSLRSLERREPVAAVAAHLDAALIAQIPSPRVVFVNGAYSAEASDLASLPAGIDIDTVTETVPFELEGSAHTFSQVNAALNQGGVRIQVTSRTEAPLHLAWIASPAAAETSQHNTHTVTLAEGASLCLVEHVLSAGAHRHIATNRLVIALDDGAELEHVRSQTESDTATWIARTEVTLQSRAQYRRLDLELGSALSRHELSLNLLGNGATVHSNGILLGDGKRHVDTRLNVLHDALNTRCDLNWRGLGTERSRITFHGGIVIAAGADHTEASLSNKNLLLSDHAEIDTQPVLEIHADEVQAAHGATVGQLDLRALFYLRSRGIDEATAKTMLIAAFCHELLAPVSNPALRDWLGSQLDASLIGVDLT